MNRPVRVIPALLLHKGGLYKTVQFAKPQYVGDPVNAVRVFNDKEADELLVLDIDASVAGRGPNLELLRELATEAFMPVCYGGGIRSVRDFDDAFSTGLEKVAVNSAAIDNPKLIEESAERFGSQSVAASIDAKRHRRGWRVYAERGRRDTKLDPVALAKRYESAGAGEILLQSIDRDGTGDGYDLDLIASVATSVAVPVIALGGAAGADHFRSALKAGAAGVAAGSHFVFHGRRRAVLISYLNAEDRSSLE